MGQFHMEFDNFNLNLCSIGGRSSVLTLENKGHPSVQLGAIICNPQYIIKLYLILNRVYQCIVCLYMFLVYSFFIYIYFLQYVTVQNFESISRMVSLYLFKKIHIKSLPDASIACIQIGKIGSGNLTLNFAPNNTKFAKMRMIS